MTDTPLESVQVRNTAVDAEARRALLVTAARTAAALVPSPAPLDVDPGGFATPSAEMPCYLVNFTGSQVGVMFLVLDEMLASALAAAAGDPAADAVGGIDIADTLRPALEAAIGTLGPCVLADVELTTFARITESSAPQVVSLVGDGTPMAWLGMSLQQNESVAAAKVPSQRPETQVGGVGLELLRGVEMTLSVEIGRTRMTVKELMALAPGSVVELDRAVGSPADLLVNGRLIARGQVVVVDEEFGLRVTELVDSEAESAGA